MRTVIALLAAFPLASVAAGPIPPKPERYVTDGAGVLDPARAAALDARLAEFERRTSNQVLVWIAPRVPEGITMEELGAEAIRAWGVGQRGKDNGVVLFVFTEQKRTRLATGYGLEGAIPDIAAKRILVDLVRPHVQRGDFEAAVEAGTDAILQLATDEGYAGTGSTVAERDAGPPWLGAAAWVAVVALLVVAYGRRSILASGAGAAAGVIGSVGLVQGFTPAVLGMQAIVLALFAPVAFVFLVVQALGGRRAPRSASSPDAGWSPAYEGSSSSDWSSSSSDASSSSSGFDGGGGDSGGGGASDDGGGSSSDP